VAFGIASVGIGDWFDGGEQYLVSESTNDDIPAANSAISSSTSLSDNRN
jgi:hypothetical protein